jgi:precorrin-6B methylase 2
MQLATGYWNSAVLLSANELNLFSLLAEGPLPVAQIAIRLQCDPHSLVRLLDACVGMGLLTREERPSQPVYANTQTGAAFLVQGQPGYLGEALRWSAAQYAAWGDLTTAVRNNAPVQPASLHLGGDPQATRTFVLGMHNRALATAHGVLPYLDFAQTHKLLDVGGGPATYAVLLAQKYPQLQIIVLDLPEVIAIAQELIQQAGGEHAARIHTRAGNATTEGYGSEEFDGVLFSGVLHQMDTKTIADMLRRAWQALRPGGRVVISDIMLESTKTQPVFAALFSLQMLLTSEGDGVFAASECVEWLEQAGYGDISEQRLPPPLPYTVIEASKPSSGTS